MFDGGENVGVMDIEEPLLALLEHYTDWAVAESEFEAVPPLAAEDAYLQEIAVHEAQKALNEQNYYSALEFQHYSAEVRELEGCEPAYLTLANEEAAEEAKAAADYRKRVQTLAEALESMRLSEDESLLHEAPCHGTPVRGTPLGEAIARSSGDPQYVADFGLSSSPKRPRGRRKKGRPSPRSSHFKSKALNRARVQKYRYVAKELAVPENELPKPDLRFSKEMELWEKGLESYCGSVDLREEQEL